MHPLTVAVFLMVAITAVFSHGHEHHFVPHYHFEYGVHDPHTHDVKEQHEYRHGDHVKGGYTMKEADGTHRIVEYTSGPHEGFRAVVKRVGHATHPSHHGHEHPTSYVGVTHWGHGSGR
ncbi:cuticle protein 19-like [Cylas formicarius]|uniref:cuticle protein 19-like n=1 Tax=Cylas formicarius TaxID=197179 RepID=UPI002958B0BB|nr:cuticle protein 19-like [Cylas formicarius]